MSVDGESGQRDCEQIGDHNYCRQQPCPYKLTVEALLICHVVHQQDSHSSSVVCGCDGAEALLSCGVPYLQLHALAVELDGADLKVDADCGDEGGSEGVFAEAQQTARLANAGVSNEKQLDLQYQEIWSAQVGVLGACSLAASVTASKRARHQEGLTYKEIVIPRSRHCRVCVSGVRLSVVGPCALVSQSSTEDQAARLFLAEVNVDWCGTDSVLLGVRSRISLYDVADLERIHVVSATRPGVWQATKK
jgi:hypothetical protein